MSFRTVDRAAEPKVVVDVSNLYPIEPKYNTDH